MRWLRYRSLAPVRKADCTASSSRLKNAPAGPLISLPSAPSQCIALAPRVHRDSAVSPEACDDREPHGSEQRSVRAACSVPILSSAHARRAAYARRSTADHRRMTHSSAHQSTGAPQRSVKLRSLFAIAPESQRAELELVLEACPFQRWGGRHRSRGAPRGRNRAGETSPEPADTGDTSDASGRVPLGFLT